MSAHFTLGEVQALPNYWRETRSAAARFGWTKPSRARWVPNFCRKNWREER